jgi:hypothetical protein
MALAGRVAESGKPRDHCEAGQHEGGTERARPASGLGSGLAGSWWWRLSLPRRLSVCVGVSGALFIVVAVGRGSQ